MASKYELKKSHYGHYFFDLKAGNGEVLLTGETHVTLQSALDGIASVRSNARLGERYERKITSDSQPYFLLKTDDGRTLAKSEIYPDFSALENGIAAVEHSAADAAIADLTEA